MKKYTYNGLTFTESADGSYLSVRCKEKLEHIVIPSQYNGIPVRVIEKGGFKKNKKLLSIVIPESIVHIQSQAFRNCPLLESVTFFEKDTSSHLYADTPVESLFPDIVLRPDTILKMEDHVFHKCENISRINIQSIEKWMKIEFYEDDESPLFDVYNCNIFANGQTIEDLVIPSGTEKISNYTFGYWKYLKNISIPNSVTEIGNDAFTFCSHVSTITLPDSITEIGHHAFSCCNALISIDLPDGITRIRHGLFLLCESLSTVSIPKSVTCIESYAFSRCKNLTCIKYSGTKQEWNGIVKEDKWDEKTSLYVVCCTDGTLTKSDN